MEPDQAYVEWEDQAKSKLSTAVDSKHKVKKALLDLEKKQADKVAAALAERQRQARLAAEAAARAKREQEAKVAAEQKRLQAAELKRQQDAVKAGNKAEAQALKVATANFKAAKHKDNMAKLSDKRMAELSRAESALLNAYIACFKQYRMWFVTIQCCQMRLEAREKRPPSELFADNVQACLEKELSTVNDARATLKGLVDEGEKLNAEIVETKRQLVTGTSRSNVISRRKNVETVLLQKASSTPSLPSITEKSKTARNDFIQSMNSMFETSITPKEELLQRVREQCTKAAELTVERNKSTAFKIDLFCRNLTPIRAAEFFKSPDAEGQSPSQTADLSTTNLPMEAGAGDVTINNGSSSA